MVYEPQFSRERLMEAFKNRMTKDGTMSLEVKNAIEKGVDAQVDKYNSQIKTLQERIVKENNPDLQKKIDELTKIKDEIATYRDPKLFNQLAIKCAVPYGNVTPANKNQWNAAYTQQEKDLLRSVRENIPRVNEATVMQKIISENDLKYYLDINCTYDKAGAKIGNCTSKAIDVLPHSEEYIKGVENLRLDYLDNNGVRTAFPHDDTRCNPLYVIRYQILSQDVDNNLPYGDNMNDAIYKDGIELDKMGYSQPLAGTGFTATSNAIIPEYLGMREAPYCAEIYELSVEDGKPTEKLKYVYDSEKMVFVEPENLKKYNLARNFQNEGIKLRNHENVLNITTNDSIENTVLNKDQYNLKDKLIIANCGKEDLLDLKNSTHGKYLSKTSFDKLASEINSYISDLEQHLKSGIAPKSLSISEEKLQKPFETLNDIKTKQKVYDSLSPKSNGSKFSLTEMKSTIEQQKKISESIKNSIGKLGLDTVVKQMNKQAVR